MNVPSRRNVAITVVALAVLIYVGGFFVDWVVPRVINIPELKTKIETSIQQSTGIRAKIKTLVIQPTLFQGVRVVFDNSILTDPGDVKVVNAGVTKVYVRYLPLLFKQTSVSGISFENIRIYIGERSFLFRLKKPNTKSKDVVVENARVEFINADIVVDRYFDSRNKYLIHTRNLTLNHILSNQALTLDGSGTGYFGVTTSDPRIGDFNLQGKGEQALIKSPRFDWRSLEQFRMALNNVQLSTLSSISTGYGISMTATGQVNELSLTLNGKTQKKTLRIIGQTNDTTRINPLGFRFRFDPGKLSFRTRFGLDLNRKLASLDEIKFKLEGKGFKAKARGSVFLDSNSLSNSRLDLRSETSWLSLRALALLPAPNRQALAILENLDGRFSSKLHVAGSALQPALDGSVKLDQVALYRKNSHEQLLSDGMGTVYVHSVKHIGFGDLHANIGQDALDFKGVLDPSVNKIDGQLRADRLDLAKLQEIALQLAPTQAALRQVRLNGLVAARITMEGRASEPRLFGQTTFKNIQADSTTRKPIAWIRNLNGRVAFEGGFARLDAISAQVAGGTARINGTITERFQRPDIRILLDNVRFETIQQWLAALKPDLAKQVALSGPADGTLHIGGTLRHPALTGNVALGGVQANYKPKNINVRDIRGQVGISQSGVQLNNITARAMDIPLKISGSLDQAFKRYELLVTGQHVPLTQLVQTVGKLEPGLTKTLAGLGVQSGTADANVRISSALADHIGGKVTLNQVSARPASLQQAPVTISRLTYDLASGRVETAANAINLDGARFRATGYAGKKGTDIHVVSNKIPVEYLRTHEASLSRLAGMPLPTLLNTHGSFAVDARVGSAAKQATLRFYDAGASVVGLKYPLYSVNGTVKLDNTRPSAPKVFTDNLNFRYGNSPTKLAIQMNSLRDLYIQASGVLSPLLVNDFPVINKMASQAYAAIPYDIDLSGSLGRLGGDGRGNNLNLFVNVNIASLFNDPKMEKPTKATDPSLNQATLSSVAHLSGDTVKIEQTRLRTGPNSSLLVEGYVDNVFTGGQRKAILDIVTEPVLDLAELGRTFSPQVVDAIAGTVKSAVRLTSQGKSWRADGDVDLNQVRSSGLEIEELTGKVTFKNNQASATVTQAKIPGVDIGFTAEALQLGQYPLPITDFNITGKEFVVAQYVDWSTRIITGKVRQGFWEKYFPNTTGKPASLPFDIQTGVVKLDEAIVNNIILENVVTNIRIYPNTYFELNNADVDAAGGHVKGYFALNPRDNNFTTVHLDVNKAKANAASKLLLNVSNEIFGDLNGIIDYTAEGMTQTEQLASTNGFVDIRIDNGRLPTVAKIETLLGAANTVAGGLANLNLNSLFRVANPFKTESFSTLTGTAKMVEGVIHTDDLQSKGKDLLMTFKGDVRMADGYGDMIVQGRMSREIGGVLGPLGNLSFGRVFGILPPLAKIVSHIPGLGFVPGFGGPRDKGGIAFQVQMKGPMIDPGSVQNFKWIK